MVRGEHRPDRGHDHVERFVVEGQVLGVGLDPFELDALGSRSGAARLEQLRGQVASGHLGARLGRRDRSVAGAGGDIEHLHAGADPRSLDEPGAERQQEGLDHRRVIAGGPHLPVACLELSVGA